MQTITEPGIYTMPMADYLADPCPEPSLSAGIAHTLLSQSAEHAWTEHRRLNPVLRETDDRMDLGTAIHALLLEDKIDDVVVVDAKDWRTKLAQSARDAARLAGKQAILKDRWEDAQAAVKVLRKRLAAHKARPVPFTGGRAEQTLVWREGTIWCRARLDWLHDDQVTIDDAKTTDGSANPEDVTRNLFGLGYDVKAAFYMRGLRAVLKARQPDFRFVFLETWAPYGASVVGLDPMAQAMADEKVAFAIARWAECLERNVWPGYLPEIAYAEAPPWELERWGRRRAEHLLDDGRPIGEQLAGFGGAV